MTRITKPGEVAGLLKQWRADSGKSVRAVASETGVNSGSLLLWENGAYVPKVANLLVLAAYYKRSIVFGEEVTS